MLFFCKIAGFCLILLKYYAVIWWNLKNQLYKLLVELKNFILGWLDKSKKDFVNELPQLWNRLQDFITKDLCSVTKFTSMLVRVLFFDSHSFSMKIHQVSFFFVFSSQIFCL